MRYATGAVSDGSDRPEPVRSLLFVHLHLCNMYPERLTTRNALTSRTRKRVDEAPRSSRPCTLAPRCALPAVPAHPHPETTLHPEHSTAHRSPGNCGSRQGRKWHDIATQAAQQPRTGSGTDKPISLRQSAARSEKHPPRGTLARQLREDGGSVARDDNRGSPAPRRVTDARRNKGGALVAHSSHAFRPIPHSAPSGASTHASNVERKSTQR